MTETPTSPAVLAEQVAELSRRLSSLEERLAPADPAAGTPSERGPTGLGPVAEGEGEGGPEGDRYWVLSRLREELAHLGVKGGGVLFAGEVAPPSGGTTSWQRSFSLDALLNTDWSEQADTLAALGQPVRLRLIQALLEGRSTVAELTELEGLGTSGQVYHHLRQLAAAGWLESPARGQYQVPSTRLVPLLVTLGAVRR